MIALSMITSFFAIMAIISGSILGVLVYLDNRKARIDAGIAQFRRHIDALSPESRRSSVHREVDERWKR